MSRQPEAILLAIGSELVSGAVQDTNTRFATQLLAAVGIRVRSIVQIGDEIEAINRHIKKAQPEAEVVILSGGLGPTKDDLTREAIALACGRKLIFQQPLMDQILARYSQRGIEMPPSNRSQAFLPEGAEALDNFFGTAPGILVSRGTRLLVALPGVPSEFCHMFEERVIPLIVETYGAQLRPHRCRCLLATGESESHLGEQVQDLMVRGANPDLGLTAKVGAITLRLVAHGETDSETEALLNRSEKELRERLGPVLCEGYPGSPEDALAAIPEIEKIAVVDGVGAGALSSRLCEAGVEVASWAGSREFLRGNFPEFQEHFGAVEAAVAGASRAGCEAGLAILVGEEDFLFVAAVLGEEAFECVVVPCEEPEANRRRCEARALDGLRRLARGLPQAEEPELANLAEIGDEVSRAEAEVDMENLEAIELTP
jgi:competence/damage-inducible protein CinA-like protein